MNISSARFFGVYGCDAYGAGTYNSTCTASTASGDGGILANTGYDVLLPLALGAALMIAAVILLVKKLRRRKVTK